MPLPRAAHVCLVLRMCASHCAQSEPKEQAFCIARSETAANIETLPADYRSPKHFRTAQVMVPGNPKLSLTTVWALPYDPLSDWAPETPFARSLRAFVEGDITERGNIFKLIPR